MRKYSSLIGILLALGACASGSGAGGDASDESTPQSNANFALGVSAYTSGQYASALNYFVHAEELVPNNPAYEMHTGLALMSLERNQDAEKKLTSACSKIKEYPTCWNNLSAFYLKTNRPKEALVYSQKAAASSAYQTPEIALANQARALIELKRYKEALDTLTKAERIGQPNCSISLLQAQINNRLRYYDVALDSAKRAESMCSANPNAHFWVAFLQQKNGHTDLAIKKFRSILETFRDEKIAFQTNKYLDQLEKRIPLKEPQI